jgi:integrase
LQVRDAKTDAGVRRVDLLPALREELSAHKAQTRLGGADDYVFPTETGALQNPSNIRNRVLAKAIERADENLAERGATPLPEGLTPHSLRRTFISLLLALGEEVPYVMRQVGHTDPKVTLSIYAQVMFRGEGESERLRALVEGSHWALLGTEADSEDFEPPREAVSEIEDPLDDAGGSDDGRGWFRTSDLSRVKRALSH